MPDNQTRLSPLQALVAEYNWQAELSRTRALSTSDLKHLWNNYDGFVTANSQISGEAVHLILNERGEGEYCAV